MEFAAYTIFPFTGLHAVGTMDDNLNGAQYPNGREMDIENKIVPLDESQISTNTCETC